MSDHLEYDDDGIDERFPELSAILKRLFPGGYLCQIAFQNIGGKHDAGMGVIGSTTFDGVTCAAAAGCIAGSITNAVKNHDDLIRQAFVNGVAEFTDDGEDA